jgi:hypothetical protein
VAGAAGAAGAAPPAAGSAVCATEDMPKPKAITRLERVIISFTLFDLTINDPPKNFSLFMRREEPA